MSGKIKKNKQSKKEKYEDPFPEEDREDAEAYGYESSAEMDLEDKEAEE